MSRHSPIGLFYGSSTCYTEFVGEKIAKAFTPETVELHKLGETTLENMQGFDKLILGIPTWDYGELQEDWENEWSGLDALDLQGKTIALYGVGDQVGYPEWFLDALGYLHQKVINLGANIIGYWPNTGYEFTSSQGLTEDGSHFVGLAIDEENQFELTDERIQAWVAQLKNEFGLSSSD